MLRGFKRYWHRSAGAATGALKRNRPPDNVIDQYTAVRPVKPGVTFRALVRFENLSRLELGALLLALDLPESCRHKLGMGKPLGLGTVRVAPALRLYVPADRYADLLDLGWKSEGDCEATSRKAKQAFRNAIIGHYKHLHPTSTLSADSEDALWGIRRLRELRALLEWNQKPQDNLTRYIDSEVLTYPSAAVVAFPQSAT